jgi:hypothetical protein
MLTFCQLQFRHLTRTGFAFLEAVAIFAFLNSAPLPNWREQIGDLLKLVFDIL